MEMKIDDELLEQIESDLGLNRPLRKGESIQIRNCWHFSTDGNSVETLFDDEIDFKNGMNRIFVVVRKYRVIILAFVLMDTHIHFVLWGSFDECNRFVHDYVNRTSQNRYYRYRESKKLQSIKISHQVVDTDGYLKTVICYVIKNPPVGRLPFSYNQYPWSSGALYFSTTGLWTSPAWTQMCLSARKLSDYSVNSFRKLLNTREMIMEDSPLIDSMVFPGEYVAYELVEQKIFITPKSFNYFMCRTRESDVDSRGGILSNLSIPIQELRVHRKDLCQQMYGQCTVKNLSTQQRFALAKALRARYNSSPRQIARLCGLVYSEVSNLIN